MFWVIKHYSAGGSDTERFTCLVVFLGFAGAAVASAAGAAVVAAVAVAADPVKYVLNLDQVLGPTLPSAVKPLAFWKSLIAALVFGPVFPVIAPA